MRSVTLRASFTKGSSLLEEMIYNKRKNHVIIYLDLHSNYLDILS